MNAPGFLAEFLPGVAGGRNDLVVGVEDPGAKEVGFEVLPDFFGGIQIGGSSRQRNEGKVGRNREVVRHMPAGSVDQQRRVDMGRELGTDGVEMVLHHLRVGGGQDQGHPSIAPRTEGAEQVHIGIAGIDGSSGPATCCRPTPNPRAFLADPTLILTPQFHFLIGLLLLELGQRLGEFF